MFMILIVINNKRRLTKSRTGIDPKPYINIIKEKSLSRSSSYVPGETILRGAENEELWGIWQQSFENHSADFNIDLMYLQNKYGDMLNQVTHMDTVSRPYTSNSMYSMVSKNRPHHNEEANKQHRQITIHPEPKYGTFLDSTQTQAGSTWNIPARK